MNTAEKMASRRKRLLIISTLLFIALGIAYGVWWVLFSADYESTDDAYVHGNLVQVTSQIPGTVVAIYADDTQRITKGSPLVQLDSGDTDIALKQAEATLAQVVRRTRTIFVQNDALQADITLRKANIDRAQVDLSKARNDLKRRQSLGRSGGVSGEEILHAQAAVKAAESGLAQVQAAFAASQATLETNQALTAGTTVAGHPDVMLAADKLRQAWLDSSRTRLPAPVDGMIAQRSVQVGQHVSPGNPLMTIIPLRDVWVEANFKEAQLRLMKPGQDVTLTSDLYGTDTIYHGKVQGIAAGTGSAFALLPAQNASGNWIKVVQRVPVRITLDPEELASHPLRVGLSMNVEVELAETSSDVPASNPETRYSTAVFTDNTGDVDARIKQIINDNLGS